MKIRLIKDKKIDLLQLLVYSSTAVLILLEIYLISIWKDKL